MTIGIKVKTPVKYSILIIALIILLVVINKRCYFENLFIYMINIHSHVIVGKDGWLFYDDGIKSIVFPPKKVNLLNIINTANFLKSCGVRIIIVPVPDKEMFYNSKIADFDSFVFKNYIEFILKLKQQQVEVCNVLEVLNEIKFNAEELYFKNDSHWSSNAINVVSNAVVNQFLQKEMNHSCQRYELIDTVGTFYPDLLKLLRNKEILETYRGKTSAEINNTCNSTDSSIVVFGDSFAEACSSINGKFGDIISFCLQKPVKTVFKLGAGYKGYKYLRSYKKVCGHKTKIAIWLFAFRSQLDRPD